MADVEEIRVFIASPSDVEAERDALERVIESVNLSVAGLDPPVRLRAIRWETAVQPAIGETPRPSSIHSWQENMRFSSAYCGCISVLQLHDPTPALSKSLKLWWHDTRRTLLALL